MGHVKEEGAALVNRTGVHLKVIPAGQHLSLLTGMGNIINHNASMSYYIFNMYKDFY